MINWNSGANLSNNGTSDYLRNGSFSPSLENTTKIIMPKNGSVSKLVVQLNTTTGTSNPAPGAGQFRTFVVRKNCEDTELSVTIRGDDVIEESKPGIVIHVNKFDVITLAHKSSVGIKNPAIAIASVVVS
uniref:Uncharacterized protein n=1 Tax=viral metagenome TaxID=1070528 RepID=A0A6C0CAJ7_9ZZZZ